MGILLNIRNYLLGYSDFQGQVANPAQRSFDWNRQLLNIPANNCTSDYVTIEPGASTTLFDGTRTLPQAMTALTTQLSISKLSLASSKYRLSITTGPGQFRAPRDIGMTATSSFKVTVNNSSVATLEYNGAVGPEVFTAVQVGDILRIKGPKTGDTSGYVFSQINAGYWKVIAKNSSKKITIRRPEGQVFEGVTEAAVIIGVTDTANQLMIYSPTGIQKADSFILAGTVSSASFGDYEVQDVGPTFIDFVSGYPLPEESGLVLQALSDIIFYGNAKKLLYVECDQNSAVRMNEEQGDNNVITPIAVNNERLPGYLHKWGHTYKCIIVNKSSVDSLNVKWIAAE